MKTLFWIFRNLPQKGRFIFWGLLLSAEMGSVLVTPALLQSLYEKNNSAIYLPVLILCSIFILLGSLGQSQIYQQGICKLRNGLWKQHLQTSLLHMRTEGEVFTLLIDDAERSMIFLQGFTAASLFRGFVFVGAAVIILAMKSVDICGLRYSSKVSKDSLQDLCSSSLRARNRIVPLSKSRSA